LGVAYLRDEQAFFVGWTGQPVRFWLIPSLRLGTQPWEALPALGTSKLKNIQLFLWDGLLARPINWAGFLAHPTHIE